jgi:hypothetical protein
LLQGAAAFFFKGCAVASHAAFQRATKAILRHLGATGTLRGSPTLQPVDIERGVQYAGLDGEVVVAEYVGTFDASENAQVGNAFSDGADNYKLDVLMDDDGYARRFVLLKV